VARWCPRAARERRDGERRPALRRAALVRQRHGARAVRGPSTLAAPLARSERNAWCLCRRRSTPLNGLNGVDLPVIWARGGEAAGKADGQEVQLRFTMQNAQLFSFWLVA
jgi:hypothetical protein